MSATTGRIAGIARHLRAKAPMETITHCAITLTGGVGGDFRGGMKGQPHRRQVTLMEHGDWAIALAEIGVQVAWEQRRINLLVDGLDLPQRAGARLRVGTALLEVTIQCDPCFRMDAVAPGLKAALQPDWRGGVCTMVIEPGEVGVGDQIKVEQ